MERSVTSEEKLLKLIRQKSGGESNSSLDKNSEQKSKIKKDKKEYNLLDLLSGVLILVIVLIIFCIAWLLFFSKAQTSPKFRKDNRKATQKKVQEFMVNTKVDRKPFSYYEKQIKNRDIFMAPWEAPKPEEAQVASQNLTDFKKEYAVIGIVLDEKPTVILEDKKTKNTIFLMPGDKIKDATLRDIKEDKIILEYNGEKIELKQ